MKYNIFNKISKDKLLLFIFFVLFVCNANYAREITSKKNIEMYSDVTMPLIKLPTEFISHREHTNYTPNDSTKYVYLIDAKGPGCIRSFWLLQIEGKTIEINIDNAKEPQVKMPLTSFMGSLLAFNYYTLTSAPFISLPNELNKMDGGTGSPGYTCYLPIPFQKSCKIKVYFNESKENLAAMVNWHEYDKDIEITPYRFYAAHHIEKPAKPRGGMFKMLETEGNGFVAGLFLGIKQLTHDDWMYHTGGQYWFIDGEIQPSVIRGTNMEDDFNFTWGFHPICTPWFGCPYHRRTDEWDQEAVAYRFFGPDPISFRSSLLLNTGCRADNTESVVYYYLRDKKSTPIMNTPKEWQVVGPFPCKGDNDFNKAEFIEDKVGIWDSIYVVKDKEYKVQSLKTERTWTNFQKKYITSIWTPNALTNVSVYARTFIESDKTKKANLKLSFDDWVAIWINGEKIGIYRNEKGFDIISIPIRLNKGKNNILIKYANFDKIPNNKLWVINMVLE